MINRPDKQTPDVSTYLSQFSSEAPLSTTEELAHDLLELEQEMNRYDVDFPIDYVVEDLNHILTCCTTASDYIHAEVDFDRVIKKAKRDLDETIKEKLQQQSIDPREDDPALLLQEINREVAHHANQMRHRLSGSGYKPQGIVNRKDQIKKAA